MDKRLYRSRTDSTIGGVCGGLGEYFGIDPTFVRIVAVLLIFADGIGVIGYLIGWIIIPRRPLEPGTEKKEAGAKEGKEMEKAEKKEKPEYAPWNKYIPGAILICIGVFFIVREHFWWWHLERFWPALLIIFGIFLIVRFGRKKEDKGEAIITHGQEGTNETGKI